MRALQMVAVQPSEWQLGGGPAKPLTVAQAVKEVDGLYCTVHHSCAGQFQLKNSFNSTWQELLQHVLQEKKMVTCNR